MRQTVPAAWRETLDGDCRHAARSLIRAPAFAVAAILTIALGIGANTAVFSMVHRALLDPLLYRDPAQLVHIAETHPDFPTFQLAAPDFFDWQRTATSFEGIAAYTFQAVNIWAVLGDGDPEPVHVVQASSSLFELLGARPLPVRTYTAGGGSGEGTRGRARRIALASEISRSIRASSAAGYGWWIGMRRSRSLRRSTNCCKTHWRFGASA